MAQSQSSSDDTATYSPPPRYLCPKCPLVLPTYSAMHVHLNLHYIEALLKEAGQLSGTVAPVRYQHNLVAHLQPSININELLAARSVPVVMVPPPPPPQPVTRPRSPPRPPSPPIAPRVKRRIVAIDEETWRQQATQDLVGQLEKPPCEQANISVSPDMDTVDVELKLKTPDNPDMDLKL